MDAWGDGCDQTEGKPEAVRSLRSCVGNIRVLAWVMRTTERIAAEGRRYICVLHTAYYKDKLRNHAHAPGAYVAATDVLKHACAQQQDNDAVLTMDECNCCYANTRTLCGL